MVYYNPQLANARKLIPAPQISSYEIKRDNTFVGYKNILKWNYGREHPIAAFRVWRAISPVVQLRRFYAISQYALERITSIGSFPINSVALYDKSYFSQNSQVTFFTSSSDRHDKKDESDEILVYNFNSIGVVPRNINGEYKFIDKRVKFGETYIYVISAISETMFESPKSMTVTVPVEDIISPLPPKSVDLTQVGSSILMSITDHPDNIDVAAYDIYKKEKNSAENFKKIMRLDSFNGDNTKLFDSDLKPGKSYLYKVYSVDFFDNISFYSDVYEIAYDSGFWGKKDIPAPIYDFKVDSGEIIFKGRKNHPDVIGYRIERKDVWRFEKGFEIKNNADEIPWPNVNLFDKSGSFELIDNTIDLYKVYQYKITSVKKNNLNSTISVTPLVKTRSDFAYSTDEAIDDIEETDGKINNFIAEVEDVKQIPLFVKFNWNITGKWNYLLVEIVSSNGDVSYVKVDNIHFEGIHYTGLKKGNSYTIKLKTYDFKNRLLDQSTEINTARLSL